MAQQDIMQDGTPYPFASGPVDNGYKLPINTEEIQHQNIYPIWISSEKYKKLLCIMSFPEYKIWYKDEEITQEQLLEILNK